jgi:GNAT superfamily N-acetyltransferase
MPFHPVEENLREMFRVLARERESGEICELPGVSIASLGSPFQMFNAAFLSGPVADEAELKRRIAVADVMMQSRGLPWAYWVCESWLPAGVRRRAARVFERHGMALSAELPGMVAEELRPAERPLPEMEVRRTEAEATLGAFHLIGSNCFRVPLPWFRDIFDHDRPDFASYVGYAKGEPVASVATVTAAGVVGVYNVATAPAFRKRGYGEAVMRHALEQAGAGASILQATKLGLSLYERMGYRAVTRFLVFTSR